MCFSAPVSFTASAVLAVVGIATLRQTTHKNQIFAALAPIFFAVQQLNEGFLWIALTSTPPNPMWISFFQKVFLFFGGFFWPVWIPFALFKLERAPVRRKIFQIMLLLAVIYVVLALRMYFTSVSDASLCVICNYSIQYPTFFQGPWKPVIALIYWINVTLSPFVSAFPLMWILGALGVFSYAIAYYFYYYTMFSVWCFYGAISSSALFLIFRSARKAKK
jgi:hypothetical protein